MGAGVPATVAMQFNIPLTHALAFTDVFYRGFFAECVKGGKPIDVPASQKAERFKGSVELRIDRARLTHWQGQGAILSTTAARLLKQLGKQKPAEQAQPA